MTEQKNAKLNREFWDKSGSINADTSQDNSTDSTSSSDHKEVLNLPIIVGADGKRYNTLAVHIEVYTFSCLYTNIYMHTHVQVFLIFVCKHTQILMCVHIKDSIFD